MDRLVYILALIVGILYTVRKLETQRQEPAHYPSVAPAKFEAWRTQALEAYTIGGWACFLTIAVRAAWTFTVAKVSLPPSLVVVVGLGIDLAWLGALGYAMYASHLARRMQREAGIVPRSIQPQPGNDADVDAD